MDLNHFDKLPDSALVPVTAFPALMGIAVSTAWRRCRTEPDFPKPIRLSQKCTRFEVGAIRRFVAARAGAALQTPAEEAA